MGNRRRHGLILLVSLKLPARCCIALFAAAAVEPLD